jgi:hypothetical protein
MSASKPTTARRPVSVDELVTCWYCGHRGRLAVVRGELVMCHGRVGICRGLR